MAYYAKNREVPNYFLKLGVQIIVLSLDKRRGRPRHHWCSSRIVAEIIAKKPRHKHCTLLGAQVFDFIELD